MPASVEEKSMAITIDTNIAGAQSSGAQALQSAASQSAARQNLGISAAAASRASFASLLSQTMTAGATASLGNFSESADSSSSGLFGGGLGLMGSGLSGLLGGRSGASPLDPYGVSTTSMLSSMMLGGLGSSSGSDSGMGMLLMLMLLSGQNSGSSLFGSLLGGNGSASYCESCRAKAAATSEEATPSAAWKKTNPVLTNSAGNRSAQAYRQVIDQFNVETNQRYAVNKKGTGDTYCNIFAWDVTSAMGAEIPHYTNPETGEPMHYPNTKGAKAMNANSMNKWLNKYGAQYGWYEVTAEEAQYYANQGMPAVTSWKNPSGHGHMQIVSPSKTGGYDASKGVAIARAGRTLRNYGHITQTYGDRRLKEVQYFAHI